MAALAIVLRDVRHAFHRICSTRVYCNASGADGGDDKSKKKEIAAAKLEALLQSIMKENPLPSKDDPLQLSKPSKLVKRREKILEQRAIDKLAKKEGLSPEIIAATKDVAENVSNDPEPVESELIRRLRSHAKNPASMSELFVGMTFDRTEKTSQEPGQPGSRAEQVRDALQRRPQYPGRRDVTQSRQHPGYSQQQPQRVNLFGGYRLNIFSEDMAQQGASCLETWDKLQERELKMSVTHPPSNAFEEMILWTEQGKLWHFPINNEQGLDKEANVSFHEHVFLENHLEPWCPKRGPIRHFMELVCIGLSKNPYITVEKKIEHIKWYHKFFDEQRAVLKKIGVPEVERMVESQ